MNQDDIRNKIESELLKRKKRVLNKNAFDALFMTFPGPVQALRKVLLGRSEVVEQEKHLITIEAILELVLRIDKAISENHGTIDGVDWTIVAGSIEAYGENATDVTGMEIFSDAGPVELKPGTHIKASGNNVNRIVGLRIGSKALHEEED